MPRLDLGRLARGAAALPRAFAWLLGNPRALRLALVPMAIAFVLAVGASTFWVIHLDDLAEAITGAKAIRVGITVVGALLTVFVFAVAYLAANAVLAGPIYEFLAERVLQAAHGIQAPPRRRAWLLEQAVSVGRELLKIAVFLFLQVAILPLWLIPGAGALLYGVLAFAVGVLYLGVNSCDYPMCAMRMATRDKAWWLGEHRQEMLGLGGAATVWAVVPLANLVLPPVAVTAGALLYGEDPAPGTVVRVPAYPAGLKDGRAPTPR